jgi:Ca2+/Na+ antiporter
MVLSFFDFLVVITNHPLLILRLVLWSKEKNELLAMVQIYEHISNVFIAFSVLALLVMSIERYLGAYYPFFHRTSLTRRKLLTLLAMFFLFPVMLAIMSANDLVISYATVLVIFFVVVFPPFAFFNYKLFKISRKVRRENTTSPEASTALHVNLRNISSCLLSVGCLVLVYIPAFFFIAFNFAEKRTSENTKVANFWAGTVANANSTLNCLIFFWKNDVLRKEGKKALKALKDRLKCTC